MEGRIEIKRGAIVVTTINPLPNSTYTRSVMGEEQVTLSWESPEFMELAVGDTVMWDAVLFTLNRLPTVKKLSKIRWRYDATFQSPMYELLKVAFMLFDQTATPPQGDFSLTGEPQAFINLLVQNMNRIGSGWSVGTVLEGEAKSLSFADESCYEVLSRLASEYETEFSVTPDKKINLNKITSISNLTFEYGETLYDIERKPIDKADLITRLYAFGSDRNIPTGYRDGAKKLLLPEPNQYLQMNVAKYGIIEASKTFDSIYPRIKAGDGQAGTVTAVSNFDTFTDAYLDFDINGHLLGGVPAKVKFLTGACAGYECEIKQYLNASKTMVIIPNEDDADFPIPQENIKPAIGDTYVLLDIAMPPAYVAAAQTELLNKATDYLTENSEPKVAYAVTVSSLYARENEMDIRSGNLVRVIDEELNIDTHLRVVKITQEIRDEYNIQVELSDTVSKGTLDRIEDALADNKTGIASVEKGTNKATARTWREVQELSQMIDTLRTDMLVVGNAAGQFSIRNTLFTANYSNNKNKFYASPGTLVHTQIPTPDSPGTWSLPAYAPTLASEGTPYYLYAKCSRTNGNGVYYFSDTAIPYNTPDDTANWYFLIGVLSSVSGNGIRAFQSTYGFTQISGNSVVTGRIQSADASTYFDLDTGVIGGNISFRSSDGGEQDLSNWVDLTDSTLNGLEKELSVTLSPDSVTLPAASDGTGANLTNAQTAVKIFKGGKELFPNLDGTIKDVNLMKNSTRLDQIVIPLEDSDLAIDNNQSIPEWGATDAVYIEADNEKVGGTWANTRFTFVLYDGLGGTVPTHNKHFSMSFYVWNNNASESLFVNSNVGNVTTEILPNEKKLVVWNDIIGEEYIAGEGGIDNYNSFQIQVRAGSVDGVASCTLWRPMIVEGTKVPDMWRINPSEIFLMSTITPQNCSAVITDTNTLKITSVNPTADFGTVDLTVEYGENTAEKRFSFAKAKAGTNGTNGTNGTSGVNSATILLYKRATSTPSLSDISEPFGYRFSTGEIITGSIGAWSRTVPAGTNPLYVISAHVQSVSDTISVYRTNFSTPTILVKDGTNGVGIVSVIPEYFLHTSGITAPHNLDMGWTSVRPAWEDNKYLWSRFTTTYTNGLMAYTTPVLDLSWNIEIGGVNLVRNGNFMSGRNDWNFGNGTEITTKVTGNALPKGALSGLQIANGNATGGIWQNFNDAEGGKYQLEFGKQYTLSFLVRWISGSKQFTFGYENLSQVRTLASGWEALQYTFTPQSAANLVFYMPANTTFQITNIQLERGNKRTDFKNGYLERALKQDTEINGGLVLSSVVAVRDDDETVTSYISGLREDENGEPMSAFAAGVKNFGQENESKMIDLRHDGSGHLAGGKFSWDEEGEPVFKGDKELHEVRIRTKPIDNFATMVSKSRSFIGFPGSPANPYGNGRSVTSGGQFSISSTLTSNTFTMDLPGEVWLNLTVTAKQNLPVVPNPSTIDCVCSVQIINNVNEEVVYTRSQSSSFQLKREKVLLPAGTYRISIYAMYGISAGVYTQGYIYTSIQWGELSFTYDMNKNHIGTDGIAVVEDDETYFYLSLTDLEWLLRARGKQRYLSQDGLNGMEITNDGVKVSGKTDIPGVLLAGYVSSGGGLNGYWGKKVSDSGAAWTSQGKYTVYHSVNHSDYFVVVTSRMPTRIPFVISKYSTYFTVEIKDQANTYQDAAFDFVIVGGN